MAEAVVPEDWQLETLEGTLLVSWPEPGDAVHDHHSGPRRISFGYRVTDEERLERLVGTDAWLADVEGHRVRVRLEELDPELHVVVGVR